MRLAFQRLLCEPNPFNETGSQDLVDLLKEAKILVVGAGGLSNHILKCLALSGVRDIHVIDMDTLELSNLNRQILFRDEDIGKFKAEVAANRINSMFGKKHHVHVTPHVGKLQDFSPDFFTHFNCVIAGLDNIEARSWLNSTLCNLVEFKFDPVENKMVPDPQTIIPLIDGGTEGFLGHCRIVLPTSTACFECTIGSFAKTAGIPMCTIIDRPRVPEHCVQYALVVEWPKERPDIQPDFDNDDDIEWLFRHAEKRAGEFGIEGVTKRLALGVVKNIVPAIASTNQIIGSFCVNEALKVMTGVYPISSVFFIFDGHHGSALNGVPLLKNPNCPACSDHVLIGESIRDVPLDTTTVQSFLEDVLPKIIDGITKPTITTLQGSTIFCYLPETLRQAHEHKFTKTFKELVDDKVIEVDNGIISMYVDGAPLTTRRKIHIYS